MNRRPACLIAFALFLAACTALFARPSAPRRGGKTIDRIPPSSFPDLPESFRKILEQRGCAIPQAFQEPQKPSNVIRGEFAQTGQRDWAVLCSKGESSSIVVFWGGPAACPAELAAFPDENYLQGNGQGQQVYSRQIGSINRKRMIALSAVDGGDGVHVPTNYPPLDHLGIEDSFVGKASEIHFCSKGKWFSLSGAD